jgi:hypothetical protein
MLIQDKHCGATKLFQNPNFHLIFQGCELTDKGTERYPLAFNKSDKVKVKVKVNVALYRAAEAHRVVRC